MGYMVSSCPHCGSQNRESCNAWGYGSPIRQCKSCKAEYYDNRWREVAIEGFDPRSNNSKLYLFAGIGSGVLSAVMGLWVWNSIRTSGSYSIRAAGLAVLAALVCVMCLVMYLRIKSGYEEKAQAPFLEESRQRMQNPEYVRKLMQYGVRVPQEFQPKDGA